MVELCYEVQLKRGTARALAKYEPELGELVYNLDTHEALVYTGTRWKRVSSEFLYDVGTTIGFIIRGDHRVFVYGDSDAPCCHMRPPLVDFDFIYDKVLKVGSIVCDTDMQAARIGDGTTPGGIIVRCK